MDAGPFDFSVNIVDVSFTDDLPDVFALYSFSIYLGEIRFWEVVVVVPDAVIIDACKVVCVPVWQNRLVIPEFVRVFVGSGESDIDVVLEQRLSSLLEFGV